MVAVSWTDEFFERATAHSKAAIAVMLVLTVALGTGAPMVDQSSSLEQFQSDTPESQKLDYIEANFTTGDENTTTVQLIVRGDDVLSRDSMISVLEFEQRLRADGSINDTLAGDDAIVGIPNVVATAAIRQEQAAELEAKAQRLTERSTSLEENRTELQQQQQELNRTVEELRSSLARLQQDPNASAQRQFDRVRSTAPITLTDADERTFVRAASQLRSAENQSEVEAAYRLGTRGVLEEEFAQLQERGQQLERQAAELETLADEVAADRAALENSSTPSLDAQIEQLESMSDAEVEAAVSDVLDTDGGGGAFAFMPTDYEPGSTDAGATMLLVVQDFEGTSAFGGGASEDLTESQLAIQSVAQDSSDGLEYLTFGPGIILDEVDRSMTDSLLIVGPLALLFVLLALAVAYRDLLDIVLGLFGIFAVLVWTFGFMGWAGYSFNQIFVAVPVLLIGLSIDYAIHIFMRHREERARSEDGSRGSMRVALAGVGFALALVTATTVIGFLSNLTSPVPPIREFGVVSSAGIVAALLVFGVLIPAAKIELDELLEGYGFDRQRRAFGTGGGRFSSVLAVGSTAARKAPYLVIVAALLVSAGGAYGATQVDTSFAQEDFLAEAPPDWMNELPEPFKPSEYSAKANLEYVNDNFVREDSQAQILVEGDVTDPATLQRFADARSAAVGKDVTQTLSTGEARVDGPLAAMRSVAAGNEAFATVFEDADTDGDGVPDTDLESVYDAFYEAAPATAERYVERTADGNYRSLRMVVSIQGGASGGDVTEQMRDVAGVVDGDGLTATATGQAILNKVVQDQLLETVIQSLLITLVAVIAFLMITYRLIEGSATLGLVTLLPVVLSVSWILGTMFLLNIPFNVLTGMITSLTVGLGVAYSIHLSERYNQELDRSDSVWEAMETAVTGTGGALLGSAATTVGGFGVLAFAILPPLQQFGIITGLTIIYAFLASVVVLPSLLVVWTRYAGPDWTSDDFEDDEDAGLGWGRDRLPTISNGTTDSTGDDPDGSGPVVVDPDGEVPASTGPERSIERVTVEPGGSVDATVTIPGADGRLLVRETFADGSLEVTEAAPDPVAVVGRDRTVYVALELDPDEVGEVRYTASVSASKSDGGSCEFDGAVLTRAGEVPVEGDDGVDVVADIFERILAEGAVPERDLETAAELFESGEISAVQFERIYREWMSGDGDAAPARLEVWDSLQD